MSEHGLEAADLLQRIAAALKSDIAPSVGDEYTRTQAFMASVIIERVAKQLALAPIHSQAAAADLTALFVQLMPLLASAPTHVTDALARARELHAVAALGPLIESLYDWGIERAEAAAALDAIRTALRNDIDRRMEVAT